MSIMSDASETLETAKLVRQLLARGEGLEVEYKRCGDMPQHDTFETICSFANRQGGNILLGVDDSGKVLGVNESRILEIQRNIVNVLNNGNLFNTPPIVEMQVWPYEGKKIIRIWVPVSSVVHRYKRVAYDRNADADFEVKTDAQMASLYIRKQEYYSERKVYRHLAKSDLRLDLLPRVRRMALAKRANHPWGRMTDDELLRSANLYHKDYMTGEEGYTLAAALLLGKDEVISDILPTYVTDAYVQVNDQDRHDDREKARSNLIEAYDTLLEFMQKHLPDAFYVEGVESKSLRDIILREVISNTLMHREYTNPLPARMVLTGDLLRVENANRPRALGTLNPENFNPLPKNPVIGEFFVNIGLADSLGSGVRNLYKYSKLYGGGDPQLTEGEVFRTIIPLGVVGKEATRIPVDEAIKILLQSHGKITLQEIADLAQVTTRTARRHVDALVGNGTLRIAGTRKNRWYAKA